MEGMAKGREAQEDGHLSESTGAGVETFANRKEERCRSGGAAFSGRASAHSTEHRQVKKHLSRKTISKAGQMVRAD